MAGGFFRALTRGVLVLLILSGAEPTIANGFRSNADTWLRSNALVPRNGFMVSRVHSIFEEVKKASGSLVHPSRLYIIQSNNEPWAVALEDKNIVLTSGAIDVIYGGDDSLKDKDARMAFVLGHELKHVIDDDFSHAEAYEYFSKSSVSELVSNGHEQSKNRKALELLADGDGLISASLAGYDTSAIFSNIGDANNFLQYWADQTSTNNSDQHNTPQERIDYLKEYYRSINDSVEFFKYGVRLAHFGDHTNARILLEDFYKVYESNRVLTNRGFVHLQLARAAMDEKMAYRYWFPDLLDLDSGLPISASRTFTLELPEEARRHLHQAVALLSTGLNSSEDDLSTRMNLITAHLFLDEYSAARAVMEKIDGWDEQPQLLGLDAIVVMQDKRLKNPWDTYSLEKLEQLASDPDSPHNLTYNFARILQENGRAELAKQYWLKLAADLPSLPKNYQIMVCRQLRDRSKCASDIEKYAVKQLHWNLPKIKPGDSIYSQEARGLIEKWNVKPIESYSSANAKILPNLDGASLLVIKDEVKLITIWKHGIVSTDELVNKYGSPSQIVSSSNEKIWSYGPQWSALVSGNKVREIWVAQ